MATVSPDKSPASGDLSVKLYSLLRNEKPDFNEALLILRRRELAQAEDDMKAKSLASGRCPICTLSIPCLHFSSRKALRQHGKRLSASPEPVSFSVQTVDSRVNQSFQDLRESRQMEGKKQFTIRYRSVNDIMYSFSGHNRSLTSRNEKKQEIKRLKIIEKLDKFRDRKYQREIERIEEYQKREELAKQQEVEKDLKRMQRDKLVKAQLSKYHEKMIQEQQAKQEVVLKQIADEKAAERRRIRYMQKQVTSI